MSGLQILTIGHSNHPFGTFLWLLQKHRIEALVDVRCYPVSRRNPHFSREALSASLAEENIEYIWLESLGGNRQRAKDAPPSQNRGIEDEGVRSYADYMDADEFRQGVARLMDIAAARRAAIMCAESDYRYCHRRLLSDHLIANNVSIQHILPDGGLEPHVLTLGARFMDEAVTYPGQPTLFDM
jgi:uncharacterized protein (DUF488 family)